MTPPTVRDSRAAREVGTYPAPPVKGPKAMYAVADIQHCSLPAAKRRLERFRDMVTDLAILAKTDPETREWAARAISPLLTALGGPDVAGLPLQALCDAAMAADAIEDLSLQRCAVNPTPDNRKRLAGDIRTEMARKSELLAALEAS